MDKWISVKTPPKMDGIYKVKYNGENIGEIPCIKSGGRMLWLAEFLKVKNWNITHWKPLKELPAPKVELPSPPKQ